MALFIGSTLGGAGLTLKIGVVVLNFLGTDGVTGEGLMVSVEEREEDDSEIAGSPVKGLQGIGT